MAFWQTALKVAGALAGQRQSSGFGRSLGQGMLSELVGGISQALSGRLYNAFRGPAINPVQSTFASAQHGSLGRMANLELQSQDQQFGGSLSREQFGQQVALQNQAQEHEARMYDKRLASEVAMFNARNAHESILQEQNFALQERLMRSQWETTRGLLRRGADWAFETIPTWRSPMGPPGNRY